MTIQLGSVRRASACVVLLSLLLAVILLYLGLSPLAAALSATSWIVLGAAGGWLIEALIGGVTPRHRVLLALGPGPLLGLGLAVFMYLLFRGGPIGLVAVVAPSIGAAWLWSRSVVDVRDLPKVSHLGFALLGCTLFANSKEFPNLLASSLVLLVAVLLFSISTSVLWRGLSAAAVVVALTHDVVTRPVYWWWSSDDTTTLSGIGTIIVERGRVDDVAGWSTSAHHWLLHAWLALWNLLSSGDVFETYLIAWPTVAAVSMFASLVLIIEVFLHRELRLTTFVVAAVSLAGFVRLDWSAPQEQQPFLIAMIAAAALWLDSRRGQERALSWRTGIGALVVLMVVPSILFVLKPSLLVAYGLLILGAGLVHFGFAKQILLVLTVSLAAVSAGLWAMWASGSWITNRSFTSFGVRWFPRDLGWCYEASKPGSLACVLSLQAVLFVAAMLSAVVVSVLRRGEVRSVSLVMLLPLIVAYLPLRYFITSGVGSGAPSFYRLPEMTMMVVVVLVLAWVLAEHEVRLRSFIIILVSVVAITFAGRTPSEVYDRIESVLVGVSLFRYLNPGDVIALFLVGLVAAFITFTRSFEASPLKKSTSFVVVALTLLSLLPATRLAVDSASAQIDPTRLSRPADFGPPDIEAVGEWLQYNTESGTLVATNYLCPTNRIEECTTPPMKAECPRTEPALMASWALTALSKREFYYLSQMWDTHSSFYLEHMTSTRLGNTLSQSAVIALKSSGVDYYVAARTHTNPNIWLKLRQSADYRTRNFSVISLDRLLGDISQ